MATPNPAPQAETERVTFTASLTSSQIEWLNDRADQEDVSVDRLVRQFVDAARMNDASTESASAAATSASGSADAETALLRKSKEMLGSLSAADDEEEGTDRAGTDPASASSTSASSSTDTGTALDQLRKAEEMLGSLSGADDERQEAARAVDETASPIEPTPPDEIGASDGSSDAAASDPGDSGSPSMFDFV